MQLEYYFYQLHDREFANPEPGISYRIAGFYRVFDYTLVVWRYGSDEEYMSGEMLFKGKERLASAGGLLDLPAIEPKRDDLPSDTYASVWDRVDSRTGNYGLSASIATQLRDPANFTPLMET